MEIALKYMEVRMYKCMFSFIHEMKFVMYKDRFSMYTWRFHF